MDTQKNLSILCQKYFSQSQTVKTKEKNCFHTKHKGRQRYQTAYLEIRQNTVVKIRISTLLAVVGILCPLYSLVVKKETFKTEPAAPGNKMH